jgi:hypothetical protein
VRRCVHEPACSYHDDGALRDDYKKLDNPPSYWLLAIRAGVLDAALEKAVEEDPGCCVLSKEGKKVLEIPEHELRVRKPLEPWLDSLVLSIQVRSKLNRWREFQTEKLQP